MKPDHPSCGHLVVWTNLTCRLLREYLEPFDPLSTATLPKGNMHIVPKVIEAAYFKSEVNIDI